MGRPKLENPMMVVSVRVPQELVQRIDDHAGRKTVKRGDLIRQILEQGVERFERRHWITEWVGLLGELDRDNGYAGLVPIQAIRNTVPDYDDLAGALRDLEHHGVVKLTGGDPSAAGIDVPGRGTLSGVVLLKRAGTRPKSKSPSSRSKSAPDRR